jgi:hypothetical protein
MAERAIYRYVPHRRTQARLAGETPSPIKVADQLPTGSAPARFSRTNWRGDARNAPPAFWVHPAWADKVLGTLMNHAQATPG